RSCPSRLASSPARRRSDGPLERRRPGSRGADRPAGGDEGRDVHAPLPARHRPAVELPADRPAQARGGPPAHAHPRARERRRRSRGGPLMPDEATIDETPAAPTPAASAAAAPGDEAERARQNHRKVREGVVVSDRMDKTAIVVITSRVRHRRYAKILRQHKKLYVHDPENDLRTGDRVRVQETRPT